MLHGLLRVRVAVYSIVALLPLAGNFVTFTTLIRVDATAQTANMIAVVVGGQVSFWSHDRLTFGDRHSSIAGWTARWLKFMPGQAGGFLINSLAAAVLLWVGATPWVMYIGALLISGGATFSWNNWVSHRSHSVPRHRA